MAAATNPGISAGIRAAPSPTPLSTISIPPTIGPPNSDAIAAKEPAAASTARSFGPVLATIATPSPTTEPSAMSGPSGPSTAPKASVPSAASAIPGA